MFTRSKLFILTLIFLLVFLSACDSGVGVSPSDPGGDNAAEQGSGDPEEGGASFHYHYLVKHPDIEFIIEQVIPVRIGPGKTPGSYDVSGIGQMEVGLRMGADTAAKRCNVHCNVILRFVAEGEIQLDENTGDCIIPMMIRFQAQEDGWILESDCPPELEATLNCAALSIIMADPDVYTFTKNKREVTLPGESSVTRQAEIKNVKMPDAVKGICNW